MERLSCLGMNNSIPRRKKPIVIAHRGAAGYLPEHTLVAKDYAYATGADYLEQDVILTRDDVPVVFHDLILDEVTDVASRFAGRSRSDGHWYVIDFDFEELQALRIHERTNPSTGALVYPGRFPEHLNLRIHSLDEELALIRGLNQSTEIGRAHV